MSDVERIRAFNRRWTEVIGLLDAGLLDTPYSLPEARVLFELGRHRDDEPCEQIEPRRRPRIDPSYLTAVGRRTEARRAGHVTQRLRRPTGATSDLALYALTAGSPPPKLDRRSAAQISALLEPLSRDERRRLGACDSTPSMTSSMTIPVRTGSGASPCAASTVGISAGSSNVTARSTATSTAGTSRSRHSSPRSSPPTSPTTGQGGNRRGSPRSTDPGPAACSAVGATTDTAQLRILIVEPSARGLGIGRQLVGECIDFARHAGYRTLMLWTNDVLVSARWIYEAAGFELVDEEPHHSFGHDLVGNNWELAL